MPDDEVVATCEWCERDLHDSGSHSPMGGYRYVPVLRVLGRYTDSGLLCSKCETQLRSVAVTATCTGCGQPVCCGACGGPLTADALAGVIDRLGNVYCTRCRPQGVAVCENCML